MTGIGTSEVISLLVNLEEERLISLVEQELQDGADAAELLNYLQIGMENVGDLFSKKEYFLAELIMAAEIFKQAMTLIQPQMNGKSSEFLGEVVFATVKGDVHDLGKNIVVAMLESNGFKVHDLGVDVPVDRIIDKVKETGSTVIGLSALLTTTYPHMKDVISELNNIGLRETVKVMIGGAPVDERVLEFSGADARGRDAIEAVAIAKQFVEA